MTKHPPHVPEVDDVPIRAMTENDANGKGGLNSPVGKGSLDESNFSSDDIVALIRAVKFAHPEMSMRGVYNEISGTMANSDESYAFLKEVRLNDVKKVWKKALKESTESIQDKSPKNAAKPRSVSSTSKPADSIPVPADGVLRFYTVGDGSVKTLVDDYANHHAGAAIATSQQACEYERQNLEKYSHFFADVPADRSGTRPHQALINFNDNRNATKRDRKNLSKAVSKSGSKAVDDGKEIFKIQLAALPAGMEDVLTPMLLYNSDRTTKTFIHPPSPSEKDEDDGGYFTIKTMITKSGTSGALGTTGGQKAYFWGIVTKNKTGPNIISIDLKAGLAPTQSW